MLLTEKKELMKWERKKNVRSFFLPFYQRMRKSIGIWQKRKIKLQTSIDVVESMHVWLKWLNANGINYVDWYWDHILWSFQFICSVRYHHFDMVGQTSQYHRSTWIKWTKVGRKKAYNTKICIHEHQPLPINNFIIWSVFVICLTQRKTSPNIRNIYWNYPNFLLDTNQFLRL